MSFPLKKLLRSPQGLVAVAALAVLLASMIALGRLEAGGVTHADLELDDGTPATLYLPGRAVEHWLLPNPPPPERRPPGVVISHAFGADRASMSTLARRLARNGYAALAIDLGGHGTNRQRFPPGRGRVDLLGPTLDASFDFLVSSGRADPERLALVGHSISAIGTLDYANRTEDVAATVLMSVGLIAPLEQRPPNLLLLFAAWDSGWMTESSKRLAARHAGVKEATVGRTYGSHDDGSAIRVQRIAGANHFAIVLSRRTAAETIAWLDASLDVQREEPLRLGDPRWAALIPALLAGLVLLFGLGDLLGALAPEWPAAPVAGDGSVKRLGVLAAVFGLTLPVLSTGERLAWFTGLEALDTLLPQLGLIGGLLLALGALSPALLSGVPSGGRTRGLAVAALGAGLMYAWLAPISVVVRRLTPTPERLLALLLTLPLLTLFFVGLDLLLRRGSRRQAAVASLAGRALLVLLWILGTELRIVPPMSVVIAPLLLILLIPLELVAFRIYARSRNLLVTAVFESLVFGWLCTMLLPLRL